MSKLRVRFPGSLGAELAAHLERPPFEPRGLALVAHCFTCSKDAKGVVRIARALVDEGFAVFRFDFTGVGESAGDFADTNFSTNLDDLVAAADYLRREYRAPDLLVGHSLGGAAVLAGASRIPEARAVATLAAPSDTRHLEHSLLHMAPELAHQEEVEVDVVGRSVRIGRHLLDDLAATDLEAAIQDLGMPLMIFHSPQDEIVSIDHARKIYQAARHPKSFVSLDAADHLLLARESDALYVGKVLAAWAAHYMEEVVSPALEAGEGEVIVESGDSGFFNRAFAGSHQLLADEPRSVGGTDRGPTPYGLLLAALGACKSMTLRMYAERKKWPLERVSVRLEHEKIHAQDCSECESEEGRVDRIQAVLRVTGDLSEGQRQRLLEIADRCPVHRTLTSETVISTELEPEA
ncbi:MAG: alpha/beta fold hydrolase [bacterium]|nr:alpha/beta fold hydrolase [bacterium]